MNTPQMDQVYFYTVSRWDWQDGDVNQMWIQQLGDADCGNHYVAIAYNPRKDVSMVMSKPRTSYHETLQWVRKFCASFSLLPWLTMKNFRPVIDKDFTINEALRCERLLRDLVSLSMNDEIAFERTVKDREVLIKLSKLCHDAGSFARAQNKSNKSCWIK